VTAADPATIDVVGMITTAAADPVARARARVRLAGLITTGDLLAHQERRAEIRPSDFGSCRLSLWAEVHGKADIPRHGIDDVLTRLDLGTLIGAWEACLLAENCAPWLASLEYEPIGGGHIDVLLTDPETGENVVAEFKSNYETGTIKHPLEKGNNRAHVLQAGDYATRPDVGARRMIIVYVKPAAKKGERFAQFEIDAEGWAQAVIEERARLAPALAFDPPTPDPQFFWSCHTCRYSACKKNLNKNRPAIAAALNEDDFQ
jgi:hypothetical protein